MIQTYPISKTITTFADLKQRFKLTPTDEVVSSNWRDDYGCKLVNYEAMGIKEYWIMDYLGIGGVRFIGQPKQPTLSIYQLINGEYQGQQFRGKDLVNKSLIFPELKLTAEQILQF